MIREREEGKKPRRGRDNSMMIPEMCDWEFYLVERRKLGRVATIEEKIRDNISDSPKNLGLTPSRR